MIKCFCGRVQVVDQQKASIQKCIDVVKRLLIEKSTIEKKEARAKCMQNRLRLGQFVTQRVGATFQENWTDGYAFQVLDLRPVFIHKGLEGNPQGLTRPTAF